MSSNNEPTGRSTIVVGASRGLGIATTTGTLRGTQSRQCWKRSPIIYRLPI